MKGTDFKFLNALTMARRGLEVLVQIRAELSAVHGELHDLNLQLQTLQGQTFEHGPALRVIEYKDEAILRHPRVK